MPIDGSIVEGNRSKSRVLLVSPDAARRTAIGGALAHHPDIEITGSAPDSNAALTRVASVRPDWVILDLFERPEAGLSLVASLREQTATTRILVLVDDDVDGKVLAGRAREAGAAEVVAGKRPGGSDSSALAAEVACRITGRAMPASPAPAITVAKGHRVAPPPPPRPLAASAPASGTPAAGLASDLALRRGPRAPVRCLAIGVSTGGPAALAELMPQLPAALPVPVLVVQHMPPTFTRNLAASLNKLSPLTISEAQNGDVLAAGKVLLAPGGRQMKVVSEGTSYRVQVTDDPPELSCRPSVDYLYRSLAQIFGRATLGVILTGMGEDGWRGARAIHACGGSLLAQDEATSVVYGMPRGPVQEGLAPAVPLSAMAECIQRYCGMVLAGSPARG